MVGGRLRALVDCAVISPTIADGKGAVGQAIILNVKRIAELGGCEECRHPFFLPLGALLEHSV